MRCATGGGGRGFHGKSRGYQRVSRGGGKGGTRAPRLTPTRHRHRNYDRTPHTISRYTHTLKFTAQHSAPGAPRRNGLRPRGGREGGRGGGWWTSKVPRGGAAPQDRAAPTLTLNLTIYKVSTRLNECILRLFTGDHPRRGQRASVAGGGGAGIAGGGLSGGSATRANAL